MAGACTTLGFVAARPGVGDAGAGAAGAGCARGFLAGIAGAGAACAETGGRSGIEGADFGPDVAASGGINGDLNGGGSG